MPKRSRQAHVPQQSRKRKQRRGQTFTPEDVYLAPPPGVAPGFDSPPRLGTSVGRAARPGPPRLAGQLPTFERAYLIDELRRIAMTSAALMTLIIVLTVLLR